LKVFVLVALGCSGIRISKRELKVMSSSTFSSPIPPFIESQKEN